MKKVLYILASPRGDRSHSRQIAEAFLESYKEQSPEDLIVPLDLFRTNLPGFDGLAVQARYNIIDGKEHSPEEMFVWEGVEALANEFKAADKYVFATPMWNFGIPYRLKQYLDIIIQPGYTFAYSREEGFKGLCGGKPALCIYSRGEEYGEEAEEMDFQKRYLEHVLGFIGLTDIRSIVVEASLVPDQLTDGAKQAIRRAREIAASF